MERELGLVVGRHELLDFGDQFLDAGEAALPDGPLGGDPELALHLVGRVPWSGVNPEACDLIAAC